MFVWDFDLTKCIMDASLKLPGPLKAPPPPIKARSGHRSGDAIRFDFDFDKYVGNIRFDFDFESIGRERPNPTRFVGPA